MFDPDLVSKLKFHVTIEPSYVIFQVIGIHPHAEHSFMIEGLIKMSHETLELLKNQVVDMKQVNFIIVFKM